MLKLESWSLGERADQSRTWSWCFTTLQAYLEPHLNFWRENRKVLFFSMFCCMVRRSSPFFPIQSFVDRSSDNGRERTTSRWGFYCVFRKGPYFSAAKSLQIVWACKIYAMPFSSLAKHEQVKSPMPSGGVCLAWDMAALKPAMQSLLISSESSAACASDPAVVISMGDMQRLIERRKSRFKS